MIDLEAQSDHFLMERVREGDQVAFEALYSRHQRRVFAYVWRTLRDEDAAADFRQEVFMRVWQRRERWAHTGSVEGYLLRTARRMLIDDHRKRVVRSLWLHRDAGIERHSGDPESHVVANELSARVNAAIAALPERMREVVSLKRDGGLSYREIGEQLGISVKTVEVHMARSFHRLREALGDLRNGE